MCQLLGMNSLKPASLHFSLAGFFRRGGDTDEHADGWGIAYYDQDVCHLLIDDRPAASSPMAQWAEHEALRSTNVVAHIRKATQGSVTPLNCHPFSRELWGKEWVFAHNGNLQADGLDAPERFVPVGQTDSEIAFCLLLDAMAAAFDHSPEPTLLAEFLSEHANRIGQLGRFNFVLSNGEALFRTTCVGPMHYIQRTYPFGCAQLLDCAKEIDFARHNHLDDRMVIVATKPLTDEAWQPLPVDEVVAFVGGCSCA